MQDLFKPKAQIAIAYGCSARNGEPLTTSDKRKPFTDLKLEA